MSDRTRTALEGIAVHVVLQQQFFGLYKHSRDRKFLRKSVGSDLTLFPMSPSTSVSK